MCKLQTYQRLPFLVGFWGVKQCTNQSNKIKLKGPKVYKSIGLKLVQVKKTKSYLVL